MSDYWKDAYDEEVGHSRELYERLVAISRRVGQLRGDALYVPDFTAEDAVKAADELSALVLSRDVVKS